MVVGSLGSTSHEVAGLLFGLRSGVGHAVLRCDVSGALFAGVATDMPALHAVKVIRTQDSCSRATTIVFLDSLHCGSPFFVQRRSRRRPRAAARRAILRPENTSATRTCTRSERKEEENRRLAFRGVARRIRGVLLGWPRLCGGLVSDPSCGRRVRLPYSTWDRE